MKTYIKEVKKRIELVKEVMNSTPNGDEELIDRIKRFEFHLRNLLDYLEGLDAFVEKEQLTCYTCGRPLYTRKDGSLVCVEMHH